MNSFAVFHNLNSALIFPPELLGTWYAAGTGFVASLVICVLLVLTKSWHGYYSMDSNVGVQKFHTNPTPRIGGVAIVSGLWVAWFNAPQVIKSLIQIFLLAGLPAFVWGVAEDITKKVPVSQRLIATMASGLLACWLTQYSLTRVDIWGFDSLLNITFFSVLFTSFAVSGVANSINIIDGFNGLASSTAFLAFLSFALISYQEGDMQLSAISIVFAACVLGFFLVNWPFGKIFLGDGGSYFVGFSLAWVAVMLVERKLEVSAFAALLVCIHPITEVLFSIFRRKVKKLHPGHPDRLHFHSLVQQRYVRKWFAGVGSDGHNSITGLLIGSLTLSAGILANLVYQSVWLSLLSLVAFFIGYVTMYARMIKFRWSSPVKFLLVKS